jgi:hypothetical protein
MELARFVPSGHGDAQDASRGIVFQLSREMLIRLMASLVLLSVAL